MQPTREQRVRMERAHVLAWPALQTARIDGWLWRASGGGSQRANSVSTIDFTGDDPLAAIETVEARYRAAGGHRTIPDVRRNTASVLPDLLRARGYQRSEDTTTMFKRPQPGPLPQDVEPCDIGWPAWLDTYRGRSRRTAAR